MWKARASAINCAVLYKCLVLAPLLKQNESVLAADECIPPLQVGRTGRAGAAGRVTSLYGPSQAVLAQALRAAVEAGEPVEGAFSRKRSFAKKLKRYGHYVPRGRTVEQVQGGS